MKNSQYNNLSALIYIIIALLELIMGLTILFWISLLIAVMYIIFSYEDRKEESKEYVVKITTKNLHKLDQILDILSDKE